MTTLRCVPLFPVLFFSVLGLFSSFQLWANPVDPTTPLGLQMPISAKISDATVFPDGAYCFDVSVENFNEIVSAQFSMGWGDTHLQFDSVVSVTPPFPGDLQFGQALTNVGILTVSGNHPFGLGVSVPDGTVLFRLCFTVIGDPGECTSVAFTGFPLGIEITQEGSGGMDIGLMAENVEVCIVEPMTIMATTVDQLDCSAMEQGRIDLNIAGGMAPYSYTWSGPNNFSATTASIDQLPVGTYEVTITDASDPALIQTRDFEITGDFTAPQIILEAMGIINCSTPNVELVAIINNQNLPFTWEWSTQDGNFSSGIDGLMPSVDAGGTYQIWVRNTENQCVDSTTVLIGQDQNIPVANAGEGATLNCLTTSVVLDGTASSAGEQLVYEWTTLDGQLDGATQTWQALATAAGTYQLLVRDTLNGCRDSASVIIMNNQSMPEVDLLGDTLLTCATPSLMINAVLSGATDNLDWIWSSNNGHFTSPPDSLSAQVDAAGQYQLMVTHPLSFCSDTASWEVYIDTLAPQLTILGDSVLNCVQTMLSLEAQNAFMDTILAFQWESLEGHVLMEPNQATLSVDQPGTYQVRATRLVNGCMDSTTWVVVEDNQSLAAMTMDDVDLCESFTMIQANQPPGTKGQWTTSQNVLILEPDSARTEVDLLIE
ncbi:MAG: hypothetical protein AAGD05_07330, partial [Bacteroidota bacterium]